MTDADPPTDTVLETTPIDADEQTEDVEPIALSRVETIAAEIEQNVSRVIVGHESVIEHVITALLGRGHVLLDDVPGVGKTMLARSIATSVDCTFRRIQFTPDLLPTDVTGVNVFNQQTREFEFQPGPIFGNIVLGDEINRAPPKTQSALLEAMEEGQVTADGETRSLPAPFTVIATQNAIEPNRTYDLPFAELDRFMKKLHLGYPDPEDETELLGRTVGTHPIEELESVTDRETLVRARETVSRVEVAEPVRAYVTRLAGYTRENAHIGASPRGTIALLRAAQARAVINGRDYVTPDDVQAEAAVVLSHRVKTNDRTRDGKTIVADALEQVPVDG
ncbi:AAA-type ATPase (MoxR subfamily) [Natrialba magadii ATCC 43099]|uniref:ATPase n=1 Tax=Natrialba magadii (strain ATCC 43099 / DSM 3394 / CCM 3739 / CIP 104546 / IAM 13178 / JCM 8861 / NBRC 102185 / NCIMB 2190 / MS3) TaxID=547559 RepID=D3SUA4_NATMM|nr:AAA family ATPase [Natrialba magadii]ADD05162.1 AAA-type ATPase (MoxR subfamily) [Natrialba magadii ATCC 43099]ELY23200.1 ATPase [Natrialba magadii ATCC 43099]